MCKVFVLSDDSYEVSYLKRKDKRLAKAIELVGTITYSPYEDAYVFLVHEIIEQMLSIKAGNCIFNRLVSACDGPISPNSIMKLSDEQLRNTGMSGNKVTYIRSLTNAVVNGALDLESLSNLDDTQVIKQLSSVKGIGSWTSKMFLIFVLNRLDVLPFEDGAFLQSFQWLYGTRDKDKIKKVSKAWTPYSSIAARYLYRALDLGFTKEKV